MIHQYPALIHKDDDSDFGVSFPDFPGCITAGESPEEVCSLAEEALQFHIDGMLEDAEDIPDPSPVSDAFEQAKDEDALAVILVPARLPGRAKRINITIEEHLLESVDLKANTLGMSRSAFLAEGARQLLKSKP